MGVWLARLLYMQVLGSRPGWGHPPYPGYARPQVGAQGERVGGDSWPSEIQLLRGNGNIHSQGWKWWWWEIKKGG